MRPEYYENKKEAVMSYKVWRTLKLKDVIKFIGPLAGMTSKSKDKKKS